MNNSENARALQAWAFGNSVGKVTPNTFESEYTEKFRAFFVRIPKAFKGTTEKLEKPLSEQGMNIKFIKL